MIDRLNERFGTSFIRFHRSRENVERLSGRAAEPSVLRVVESSRVIVARDAAKSADPVAGAPMRALVEGAYRLRASLLDGQTSLFGTGGVML
jgi:hypothetical protein